MPQLFRPKRDITREQLIYPPHGRTSRGSKNIFVIFGVVTVAIMVFALVITFTTDSRETAIDALNTETAEVYNTAAAHSTETAAALGVTDDPAGTPTVPAVTMTPTVAVATPAP